MVEMDRLARAVAGFSAVALVGVACDRAVPDGAGVETRDSAGIAIVESFAPAWADRGVEWRIEAAPRLRIGAEDGHDEVMWFRLTAARFLATGEIVASNAGSGELRFFGPDGTFIRSVGRIGQGPGEFSDRSSLRLCPSGDGRILVEDQGNGRISIHSVDGDYLSTVTIGMVQDEWLPPSLVGCVGDGRFLGSSQVGGGGLRGNPGDVVRVEADYVAVDETGEVVARLARLARPPRFVNEVNGVVNYPFIPFHPEASATGVEGRFYVTTGSASEIRRVSEAGELEASYRWRGPAPRSVRSIWGRFVDESLQRLESADRRQQYRRFYDQPLPLPESVPAIQRLLADEQGNIWAERYRLFWEAERVWDVLDPSGRWLGSVETPVRTEVLTIGSDYLLGRHVDELGVERLVLHDLVKPAADVGGPAVGQR